MTNRTIVLAVLALSGLTTASSQAQFVLPQIGGGQTGLSNAPMKHADVTFDGTSISVHVDTTVGRPLLRPLDDPFDFDPEQPWGVLTERAYNFQYGWNPGGFISLPPAAWIWIEQIEASPELEVYQRPPAQPSYQRIFRSDGSIWKWPGSMTHNVYAVAQPQRAAFDATYRVYMGDETTGEELVGSDGLPLYGGDMVTFRFDTELIGDFDVSGFLDSADIDILSTRIRLDSYDSQFDLNDDEQLSALDRTIWIEELVGTFPGDADLNGAVEFADFLSVSSHFGLEAGWAKGDFDGDRQVQFADFLLLSQNFGQVRASIAMVPEPNCGQLILAALAFVRTLARKRNRTG